MKYKISISKTANGEKDYVQIISEDQWSTNIVLVSEAVEVEDKR